MDLTNALFVTSYVVLWVLVALLCIACIAVLRHLAILFDSVAPIFRFTTAGSDLKVREVLPRIRLADLEGREADLQRTSSGYRLVLVVQSGCAPCETILAQAGTTLAALASWTPIVVVQGGVATARSLTGAHRLDGLLVLADPDRGASLVWGITTTPYAVAVDGAGRVLKQFTAPTAQQLRQILTTSPEELLPAELKQPADAANGISRSGAGGHAHGEQAIPS